MSRDSVVGLVHALRERERLDGWTLHLTRAKADRQSITASLSTTNFPLKRHSLRENTEQKRNAAAQKNT